MEYGVRFGVYITAQTPGQQENGILEEFLSSKYEQRICVGITKGKKTGNMQHSKPSLEYGL